MEAFDKEGNLIEGVLSSADVEAKIQEAEAKHQEALNSKIETIKTELSSELKKKDDEIERLKLDMDSDLTDEEKNWKKTRKTIEQLKQDKRDLEEKLNKEIGSLKSEILGELKGNKLNDKINKVSGGDKEFAAKIMVYYNSFAGTPENDSQIDERIKNATILAGGSMGSALNGNAIRTGGGGIKIEKVGKLSEEAKDVGGKLGITNDDLKNSGAI